MEKTNPTKKDMDKLTQKLTYNPKLVWDSISANEKNKVFRFGEEYKSFLDRAKTEREAVAYIRQMAVDKGYREQALPGDSSPLFKTFHEKSIALALPGTTPLMDGINLIVSHIDAPRLDLKQRPLYEEVDLALRGPYPCTGG